MSCMRLATDSRLGGGCGPTLTLPYYPSTMCAMFSSEA
jgi:hypothetical protein